MRYTSNSQSSLLLFSRFTGGIKVIQIEDKHDILVSLYRDRPALLLLCVRMPGRLFRFFLKENKKTTQRKIVIHIQSI